MTAKHRTLTDRYAMARHHLAMCGGLSTSQDLAHRWKVSRNRVLQLREHKTFPKPAAVVGGQVLYFTHEADEWRAGRSS